LITINSGEFAKVCKELQSLSESLTISTKPGQVTLSVEGPAGNGFIKLGSSEAEKKEEQTLIEVEENVT